MDIRFTKHAIQKFEVLRRHGVFVTQEKVLATIRNPKLVDEHSRAPLLAAQSELDETRVLRVTYK